MASLEDALGKDESLPSEILNASTEEISNRTKLLENDIKIMKSDQLRIQHEQAAVKAKIKENQEKVKLNKQLPYLVSNVVELLPMDPADEPEEDGANIDLDAHRKGLQSADSLMAGTCAVVKTSTRQTIFLPMVGLVEPEKLKPGDLVGVNKDSYLILDLLPAEYDSRVKAMEVDEKPTEDYNDVGGLDKQIEEMVEAIVLPMTHRDRFVNLGIKPPKGKTLLARACAAQTNACFLKLAGPQLVQMFIGDGAKLVRDAFALAKEKAPAIIFIDEIDAIGTKRFDSEKSGDREVQRTMLELLNQLDGFASDDRIKFPHPNEEARARIMQIHSRKMTVSPDVNFDELARSCDEFNGAQCKAVCVEAGMIALRRGATQIIHEDFMEGGRPRLTLGIQEVQAKKKTTLQYYA
ncbi:26S proteasome regulatory subunit 6A A [Kappamyces sp. JEL0680]|nr:26S proteasome regulatory subunit 6A A [Kappamyces sp. JEL0680]